MTDYAPLFRRLERQWGAVAIRQAGEVGLSGAALRRLAERERWAEPYPNRGVRIHPASAAVFERRVSAALLAVGGHALAGRWTAAYLHGLTSMPPRRVELVVPHDRRPTRLARDVDVWRSRTLLDDDVVVARRLPATSPARTVCDLAAVASPRQLRELLIDGNQRRTVSIDQVLRRTRRMRGTTGLPLLRHVCWQLDAARCDSVLAEWIREALVAEGLPPDRGEHPVTARNGVTVHIDVPFVAYRVGAEGDGFGAHAERWQLDRDARRRNTLRLTDWRIVWVTWDRMEADAHGVVEEVRDELERRGWPGAPLLPRIGET